MEKTKQNSKNRQKMILIILGGAVGVFLLLFGGRLGGGENEGESEVSEDGYSMAREYADMIEGRVEEICSGVDGASDVRVFVSLAGGYRTVYAYDSQASSTGHKNQLVMSGSGADKKAVVTAYEYPRISGVGIVCRGADNANVRAQIIALVSASLDVPTNKIYVAEG